MGWWDRAISAVKSAVNKAVSAVRKVESSVVKSVSKAVKKVSSSVSRVVNTVKRAASKSVSNAKFSVQKVYNTAKETVKKVVDKVSNSVEDVKETAKTIASDVVEEAKDTIEDVKETVKEKVSETVAKVSPSVEKVKDTIQVFVFDAIEGVSLAVEKVKDTAKKEIIKTIERDKKIIDVLTWKGKLLDAFKSAMRVKLPLIGVPRFDAIDFIYTTVTGKVLTETESMMLRAKALDFIIPMNVLSVLFTGKNLSGEPEEFGTFEHYTDLALSLLIFVPVGKVGKVAGKLGTKAVTVKGLKGFMKLATTKIDDAAKLVKIMNVDDQMKLARKLSKTDDGIKIINELLAKKAWHKTIVKPLISIVNTAIKKTILLGKPGWAAGKIARFNIFSKTLDSSPGLKFLKWAVIGTIGIDGIMAWLASDNIITGISFTLRKLTEAAEAGTITKEEAETQLNLIQGWKDKATNFVKTSTIANPLLWFFRSILLINAEKGQLDIDLERKKIEGIVGLIEIPETIKAIVRDIIDGDTIDVSLDAKDAVTGEDIKLPEHERTRHARIRIVGINTPEKRPKGYIVCTDIEIREVEKKFTDEATEALWPLDDKEVILKTDPENLIGDAGRILAVVEHNGVDIGLRQIKEGLACYYFRQEHKWVDDDLYREATLTAKSEGIGMWKGLEEVEKEEDKIKIKITSIPTNAKLFLDDVALHHNTPSDEVELSDVLHLFTLGPHVLSAEKAGLSVMEDIVIVKGDNGTIHLTLVTEPIVEVPTPEEVAEKELEAELAEEKIEEVKVEEPVKVADIPKEYTTEQAWALKEAFAKVLELTEGTEIMSKKEREDLFANFTFYTDVQKEVINLFIQDIAFYTEGRKQLSADEFILLQEKYRMI